MAQYIDFAFVKENASFERILDHYKLVARGTGAQRSVLCPFHPDKRPSCRVELERRVFHCFSCETSGNILEFVAKLEDADLRAAAIKIAEICKIALAPPRRGAKTPEKRTPARKGRQRERAPAKKSGLAPAPVAAQPAARRVDYAEVGLTNRRSRGVAETAAEVEAVAPANPPLTFALKLDPAHPYLVERGLSAEVVAQFGLGYCNRGVMAGRICIPIHNERGELVAYAGRWPGDDLPEDVERYRLPKKFEKSRVLFNLHRVAGGEHIVLVEGYWSVFRLHALGVPVVALMGSSVSPEQLALLRERDTGCVTLLLDGDEAGGKARERALPDLASAFFVRAPLLPDGEKPDTLCEAALVELVTLP